MITVSDRNPHWRTARGHYPVGWRWAYARSIPLARSPASVDRGALHRVREMYPKMELRWDGLTESISVWIPSRNWPGEQALQFWSPFGGVLDGRFPRMLRLADGARYPGGRSQIDDELIDEMQARKKHAHKRHFQATDHDAGFWATQQIMNHHDGRRRGIRVQVPGSSR